MADNNRIDELYKEILGREANKNDNEYASEVENLSKYGEDQLRSNLQERAGNRTSGSNTDQPEPERRESAGNNVIQSWSQAPDTFTNAISEQNNILREMQAESKRRQDEIAAKEAAQAAKRDELYGQLKVRAGQGLEVDPNTSYIKAQVDPYRAEQTRARRNFVSDIAEQEGPYGNIRGEERIAQEREGINTSNFQAGLIGEDVRAKRAEIADALNSMRGMLTTDQQANLQRELDSYDNRLQQVNQGVSTAMGAGQMGLGYADLGLRSQLGNRGLDLQSMAQEMMDRQFYDNLGFQAGDRNSYWDAVRRQLL